MTWTQTTFFVMIFFCLQELNSCEYITGNVFLNDFEATETEYISATSTNCILIFNLNKIRKSLVTTRSDSDNKTK